jgi:hypothetical protein
MDILHDLVVKFSKKFIINQCFFLDHTFCELNFFVVEHQLKV